MEREVRVWGYRVSIIVGRGSLGKLMLLDFSGFKYCIGRFFIVEDWDWG